MNYLQYYPIDVVNGEGTRCTLFVSGCEHLCKGCHNSSSWDASQGHPFTENMVDQILRDLSDSRIHRDGLSLSGGDPLFPANLSDILHLVQRVKAELPDKNIWLWTGYLFEDLSLLQKEVVRYVDVLIDGKYEEEKKDLSLPWRGSSNQRVIKQPSSLTGNKNYIHWVGHKP
ncbi:anaerobic ribonucleotide reductase-activating protein [Endozoicomonas sp. OPT23]|uniref:anaerobic ribonucleoside-triphosphate reductase-activating protein n=1 Tax=Endozoicomonas sp. OPT23 TaxID=2072845 RepID=UPI00129B6781|nr:anaerobic ribonucleoside-triphosphate reductase-activating protein [Endozoicomonas sp. OPT23]MRI32887.1 anaerobic ribonucleotide reductase-activating protein [Endozoicomonas sp. OPT23]